MFGIDGLRGKLLVVLLAFAMLPMAFMGILSLGEMNRASSDIEENITSLATSLNRSALAVGSYDADQIQLAEAKAHQFDAFFLRIASENELLARYAASSGIESCDAPAGIWVAPTGSDQTVSARRDATVRSLCAPARLMQELHKADSALSLTYIGTEDGVLAVWPYSNKTLSNAAPFSYKDKPYYAKAKQKKQTIWTGPYLDGKGDEVITDRKTTSVTSLRRITSLNPLILRSGIWAKACSSKAQALFWSGWAKVTDMWPFRA